MTVRECPTCKTECIIEDGVCKRIGSGSIQTCYSNCATVNARPLTVTASCPRTGCENGVVLGMPDGVLVEVLNEHEIPGVQRYCSARCAGLALLAIGESIPVGFKNNDRCLAKVADDEPIFVLRAQDITMVPTIGKWLLLNSDGNLSAEHIVEVQQCLTAVAEWQAAHPDRVKRPD